MTRAVAIAAMAVALLAGCEGRGIDSVDDPRVLDAVPGAVALHAPLPLRLGQPVEMPEVWYHVYGAERLDEDLVRLNLLRTTWDGPEYRKRWFRIAVDCRNGRVRTLGEADTATAAEQSTSPQPSREYDIDRHEDDIAGHVCIHSAQCVADAGDPNPCAVIRSAEEMALSHRAQVEKMRADARDARDARDAGAAADGTQAR